MNYKELHFLRNFFLYSLPTIILFLILFVNFDQFGTSVQMGLIWVVFIALFSYVILFLSLLMLINFITKEKLGFFEFVIGTRSKELLMVVLLQIGSFVIFSTVVDLSTFNRWHDPIYRLFTLKNDIEKITKQDFQKDLSVSIELSRKNNEAFKLSQDSMKIYERVMSCSLSDL